MPRFDFDCFNCKSHFSDLWVPTGEEPPDCPNCGGILTKLFNFTPQWNGSTIRHYAERCPAHSDWFSSDDTQAKLRLPDGHPDKYEMISKSSDAAHGVHKQPDFSVSRDDVQKDITEFWAIEKQQGRAVPEGALS